MRISSSREGLLLSCKGCRTLSMGLMGWRSVLGLLPGLSSMATKRFACLASQHSSLSCCLQGSPQLSVEIMRFGSGLGPARHLSGLAAGGYASFHGPHEAEDRSVLAQALSRHMSGQALPADVAAAAAPPATEEADEEQTVCARSILQV